MRLISLVGFACDDIFYNFKKSLLTVLVLVTSLILVIISFLSYIGSTYSYNSLNDTLNKQIENVGVIRMYGASMKEMEDFYISLRNVKGIESCGFCDLGGIYGLDKLKIIQDSYSTSHMPVPEILYVSRSLLKLCDINVDNGIRFEDLCETENKMFLYLGYNYIDEVKLGETFTVDGTDYIVAGFLSKGSTWIDPQIINGIYSQQLDFSYKLDCGIVMIQFDEVGSESMLFSIKDKENMSEVISAIEKVANSYELNVSIDLVDKIFEKDNSNTILIRTYILQMLFVVVLSTAVIICAMQMSTVISSKREYGIMYINGFSKSDVFKIQLLSVGLKTLLSIVISTAIGFIIASWWFKTDLYNAILNILYWKDTMPIVCCISIVLMIISTFIPFFVLKGYSPAELMRGKE